MLYCKNHNHVVLYCEGSVHPAGTAAVQEEEELRPKSSQSTGREREWCFWDIIPDKQQSFLQLIFHVLDVQQTLYAVLNQWWDRQWRSSRDSTSLRPGNFSSKIWLPSYHWRRVLSHVVTHLTQTRDKFLRSLIMCKPGGRGHLQLVHQRARWCTKSNEAQEKQRKDQKEPDFNCSGIGGIDHRQRQNRTVKDKIE